MKTSDILDTAADLIESRGWIKGPNGWGYSGERSPLCLEGAIAAAMGRTVNGWEEDTMAPQALQVCPAGRAVRDYLGSDLVEPGDEMTVDYAWLCHWNDRQSDAAKVVATLRTVALIERAKESEDAPELVNV